MIRKYRSWKVHGRKGEPHMLKVVMANMTDTMAASGTRVNFNAIRSLLSK